MIDAVREAALASPVWRNRGRGPISDEAIMAASLVLDGQIAFDLLRAALEAALSTDRR